MTPNGLDTLLAELVARWPRVAPPSRRSEEVFEHDLADVADTDALEALRSWALDPATGTWPPTSADLVRLVAERTEELPAWDEVVAAFEALLRGTRRRPGYSLENPPPWAELAELGAVPALVAHFLAPRWREWCSCPERDYRTFYAQTRDAWNAQRGRAQRRMVLGLAGVPERATLAPVAGPHRLGDALALALPRPAAELEAERERREAAAEERLAADRARLQRDAAVARAAEERRELEAEEERRRWLEERAAVERELEEHAARRRESQEAPA